MGIQDIKHQSATQQYDVTGETAKPLGLIGAPIDVGAGRRGANLGPEALRIAGIEQAFGDLGHLVVDHGDVDGPRNPQSAPVNGFRHLEEVAEWSRNIRDKVHHVLDIGHKPVILGGDHSLSIGSIAGVVEHCRKTDTPVSVLWLDAHADFNTPDISPSGNIHGMPLATLCGAIDADQLNIGAQPQLIDPTNIYLAGIRSVDPVEKARVVDSGANVFDMRIIDEHGMVSVMRTILESVARTGGHLHVSFDVDMLDPSLAPGVGTTVPGGATYREAHICMEMIHESGLLGSLDLVELNPCLDEHNRSAELMVDLAGSAFGKQIIQRNRPAA